MSNRIFEITQITLTNSLTCFVQRMLACTTRSTIKVIDMGFELPKFHLSEFSELELDLPSTLICTEWFPMDSGMFSVTFENYLSLVDSSSMNIVETYEIMDKYPGVRFKSSSVLWSAWNQVDLNTIAIALENSKVRLIDIRVGSPVHLIKTFIPPGQGDCANTRLAWAPNDPDCLVVGDEKGYLHVYDVRFHPRPIVYVGEDNSPNSPISHLSFLPDGNQIITSFGSLGQPVLWHFRNKKMSNTNIHFMQNESNSFGHYIHRPEIEENERHIFNQMWASDTHLFRPKLSSRNEVLVNCLRTGDLCNKFLPPISERITTRDSTCVIGIDYEEPIIYSGGGSKVRLWMVASLPDDEIDGQRKSSENFAYN